MGMYVHSARDYAGLIKGVKMAASGQKSYAERLGERLTSLMEERGLTKHGLAKRLKEKHKRNMYKTICRLARGEGHAPQKDTLQLIAEALDILPTYLEYGIEQGEGEKGPNLTMEHADTGQKAVESTIQSSTSPPKIEVRRIEDPSDPDLPPALDLYCERIPDHLLREPDDIVRWLKEDLEAKREGTATVEDYFLIAKMRGEVCGLLYSHYYLRRRMMIIIVSKEGVPGTHHSAISRALLEYLLRELSETLEGVVAELESEEKKSRMRLFRWWARINDVTIGEIKIDYLQPKLSLWDEDEQEEKLMLIYGRTRPPYLSIPGMIPRSEVANVLDLIYNDSYGEAFEDDPVRDAEYRRYLKQLYERIVATLPEEVQVL
jgi:transcriptional regulator with XRE-family HTH domain